ncbi:MAG: hypothetical protein ACX930_01170 [Erythrobacter sp.]
MNFSISRTATMFSLGLAAPLLATAALADAVPQEASKSATEPTTEQAAETSQAAPETAVVSEIDAPDHDAAKAEEAEEAKRICRRIRTDMSSRRMERVCMTRDEWREFNQRR